MTTKNNRPSQLSQILEGPAADQGYPVWQEERMWAKVLELSATNRSNQQRKYWLWLMVIGLSWSAPGADRLTNSPKNRDVESLKTAPVARVELHPDQNIALVPIRIPRNRLVKKKVAQRSLPHIIPPLVKDTLADEVLVRGTKISPLPKIATLVMVQQVYPAKLNPQLPLKPWRKKYSTLYTLRVPETPYDWDLNEAYVRRLERQIKSVPPPNNGWMAFQIKRESGTAFSLVYRSKDTLNMLGTEIHLRTKNR